MPTEPNTDRRALADELERLAGKATAGEWEFDGNCGGYIAESGERIARAYARDDVPFIVWCANHRDTIIQALRGDVT